MASRSLCGDASGDHAARRKSARRPPHCPGTKRPHAGGRPSPRRQGQRGPGGLRKRMAKGMPPRQRHPGRAETESLLNPSQGGNAGRVTSPAGEISKTARSVRLCRAARRDGAAGRGSGPRLRECSPAPGLLPVQPTASAGGRQPARPMFRPRHSPAITAWQCGQVTGGRRPPSRRMPGRRASSSTRVTDGIRSRARITSSRRWPFVCRSLLPAWPPDCARRPWRRCAVPLASDAAAAPLRTPDPVSGGLGVPVMSQWLSRWLKPRAPRVRGRPAGGRAGRGTWRPPAPRRRRRPRA